MSQIAQNMDPVSCAKGTQERILFALAYGASNMPADQIKPEYAQLASIIYPNAITNDKLNQFASDCYNRLSASGEFTSAISINERVTLFGNCIMQALVRAGLTGTPDPILPVVYRFVNQPSMREMLTDEMLRGGKGRRKRNIRRRTHNKTHRRRQIGRAHV